jgi:hypothetical protein
MKLTVHLHLVPRWLSVGDFLPSSSSQSAFIARCLRAQTAVSLYSLTISICSRHIALELLGYIPSIPEVARFQSLSGDQLRCRFHRPRLFIHANCALAVQIPSPSLTLSFITLPLRATNTCYWHVVMTYTADSCTQYCLQNGWRY